MAILQIPALENSRSVDEAVTDRKETNTPDLHPPLYRTNTRLWLAELLHGLGRTSALDDIPDSELDYLAKLGFGWFLSVWQTGAAQQDFLRHSELACDPISANKKSEPLDSRSPVIPCMSKP